MERDVNPGLLEGGLPSIEMCQQPVDIKAFKGRGTLHSLRQLEAEVDSLTQQMRVLSDASKAVSGAQIYLMVHQRHSTGYVFLRWREAGGTKRHLSWEEGQALYGRYTEPLRSWYRSLAERAQQINAKHTQARKAVRALRTALMGLEPAIYARPIPG
ncbi:MAG TPA: hypothetical protein PK805_00390 [Acidovorax temperans]|nr:hypothetical protein [Acidovorax temperans]